jgi:hypothetical protein
MRMRQWKIMQVLPGPRRGAVRRWLAAVLGLWLLAVQAPLPLAHFASLAGGQTAAAEAASQSGWESPTPAAGAHDPSHCLICQAFCQLVRVLVPAATGGHSRPVADHSPAPPAAAPAAEAPFLSLAASRAPPPFV